MDPIDEQITSTLSDEKPMSFEELLSKLSVSHNTLRLHLDAMAERGEIVKDKRPSKTRGRPRYFYFLTSSL